MLCKDGYWHLVDSYDKKQPPFVMPLQVIGCTCDLLLEFCTLYLVLIHRLHVVPYGWLDSVERNNH